MSLATIVGVVFPILTVISGGGFILLYGSQSTLRATNGDQEKRIVFLEAEQVRDRATITEQATKIQVLEGVVTGQAQLAALAAQLDRIEQALHSKGVTR